MSKFDSDLEELLLSDVSFCDDSSSTDVELESLLSSLDVGEADGDSCSLAKPAIATQSHHQFENDGGGIVPQLILEAAIVTKYSHCDAIESTLINEDDESDTGEVLSTASSILAKVLSEFEEDDDDFDDETFGKADSHGNTYLSRFEKATRKESKCFSDNRMGPHCGPLDSFLSSRKCTAQPAEKFSFSSLDDITSKTGFSVTITAMHIDTSSISVGTNDGTVTVYSHDQNVLKTFHHSDLASPVTAIGISGTGSCLVCGYETGVIALWNLLQKAQQNLLLLYIDDLHFCPLQFLKIVQKLTSTVSSKSDNVVTFISSDDSGATYRVEIKKSIFMKYSYESECLLTGQASSADNDAEKAQSGRSSGSPLGYTTSLSVLPPPVHTGPPMISLNWLKMEVMAFSAKNKTFVVQLRPKVQILYRWNTNPLSYIPVAAADVLTGIDRMESNSSLDKGSVGDSGSEKSMNSTTSKPVGVGFLSLPLTWSWGGMEAQPHPLLLRVCGFCIQVLSLSLPVTESQSAEQKGGGIISFSAVEHTFEDLLFITAKWASGDGSSVAALTETHLLILSYPSFSVTDKISLLPDMCAALALTLPNSWSSLDRRCAEVKRRASDLHLMFEICGEEFYFFLTPYQRTPHHPSGAASLALKAPPCFYRIASTSHRRLEYESSVLFLVQQGKWLEALALCMQSSITADEERSDPSDSTIDSTMGAVRNVFADSLVKKYAVIAVYRHSLFTATERRVEGKRGIKEGEAAFTVVRKRNTITSYRHYQLAAQVCIQFCAAFSLTDTLFTDISEMFRITGQEHVFLIALADNVVSSRRPKGPLPRQGLRCLPVGVILSMERAADDAAYPASPLSAFDLFAFEQCVLSLDKAAQEGTYGLRGVPEVMMKHNLFSGLLWSLSAGNRDCRDVFALAFKHYTVTYLEANSGLDSADSAAEGELVYLSQPLNYPFPSIPTQQTVDGYKLLIFAQYALSHRSYPTGEPDLDPNSGPAHPHSAQSLLGLLEEIVTHCPSSEPPVYNYIDPYGSDIAGRSGSYPYLTALSCVDPEALLHVLALGAKSIDREVSRSAIDSLYMKIFNFATDSDRDSDIYGTPLNVTGSQRTMTARFFSHCSDDLSSHPSSALPTDMVTAHIRYFAAQPEGSAVSGTLDPICSLVLGEVPCTAPPSPSCDEDSVSGKRRRAVLDCLEELNCWCAVLLFEAGCCIVSEGRDLSFQDLHLLSALDYFTKSCSITSSSEKASREAFHYLRLCSRLVSGQVSDSNFRDTVTAADPVPWAHIPAAPQCGLPADTSAEADAAANRLALFRRHLADYVLDLAGMDMAEAKRMACAVYATDMDQLIAATNRSPRTQFELLSAVMEHHLCGDTRLAPVQSPSEEDSPPPVIDTSVYLRHVSLLLAESPTDLFHFLLRSTRTRCVFPVEDCLLMCTDALTDIQVAMLKPAGSDTDSNTNNSPTGSTKPGQGQGQTRWILLDSISLLKQLSGDLSGAMSAIIEYVTFALSEERRNRKGIPPRGLQGGGSDRGQRVLHGVQCLLNLCETENTRQGGHYTHTQSREGMWFGALTSLLPILGQSKLKGDSGSGSGSSGVVGDPAAGECHPALSLFLRSMQLAVSPVGTAAYILRKVPTGPSRDATSGPEDLLRVGLFRSMVAALIRGEAGTEEGMESCIAIFRMDIALLNRKSQAQRRMARRYRGDSTALISDGHSQGEGDISKNRKEEGREAIEQDGVREGLSNGGPHIQMLRAKFTDLTFRFSTFGTRFSAGATVDSSSESHSGLEEGTGQSALEGTPIDGEGETEGEGSS